MTQCITAIIQSCDKCQDERGTGRCSYKIMDVEETVQQYEVWLGELEGLAIQAIMSGNWDEVYAHILDFRNEHEPWEKLIVAENGGSDWQTEKRV